MPRTSAKDLENFQFPAKIKQCVTSKKVRVNIENPSPESDICASSDENKEETASKNCLQELASTVLTQELGVLHDSFYLSGHSWTRFLSIILLTIEVYLRIPNSRFG